MHKDDDTDDYKHCSYSECFYSQYKMLWVIIVSYDGPIILFVTFLYLSYPEYIAIFDTQNVEAFPYTCCVIL